MKKILLLISIIILVSCKESNNKKEKVLEEKQIESIFKKIEKGKEINNYFEVKYVFLAQENDNFQVFYKEDYTMNFSEENSVKAGFTGKDEFQTVVLKIPENVFPVNYKFDIGSNKNLKTLQIKSLSIRYGKNEVLIPQDRLMEFLKPNKCVIYNEANKEFNLSSYMLNETSIYDPYFTCSPELVKIIFDL